MNPFALLPLLPVLGRHADTIQALVALAPDIEAAYNECLPHVQALTGTAAKHQATIAKIEQLTPDLQALINDVLPVIRSIKT